MLKEVSKEEWIKIISEKATSVFDEPSYLETIAKCHRTKLKYWVFFRNNKSVLGFAAHHNGKGIVVPDHFSYSSFWYDQSLGDYAFFDTVDLAIKELKKCVRFFAFRLPPNINDIRGFNSNGCNTEIRYTYVCATNFELNSYRKDLKAKLNKATHNKFEFLVNNDRDRVLEHQLLDFPLFGFRKEKIEVFKRIFKEFLDNEIFYSFELLLENQLKSSAIVLIDSSTSSAYNILLSTSKNNDDTMASSLMYYRIIQYLNENGFKNFDLYGANMKGIANFKSGFKGDLTSYFIVSFSLKNALFEGFNAKLLPYVKKLFK